MKVDKVKEAGKQRFYKDLQKVVRNKKNNNSYLTRTRYKIILKQVKKLKEKKLSGKVVKNNKILKRFDIITEKNIERLIYPTKKNNDIIYYVTRNELFDILHDAHINTNHGGKTIMMHHLHAKYKNVTCEIVAVYLKNCTDCETKKFQPKVKTKESTSEVTQSTQLRVPDPDTLGSIDFINMEELPDDYRFILVYRDLRTRFVQLKPLHDLLPCDVKVALLEIFATFPAPCRIQSCHAESVSQAVEDMKKSWKGREILFEPVEDSNTYHDLWNIIVTWLNRSNTTKWSEGLKFVQYMKNIMYDEEIQTSPFEAMFGRKGKLDVNNLNLPQEIINGIRPEEEDGNNIEINELLEVVIDDE